MTPFDSTTHAEVFVKDTVLAPTLDFGLYGGLYFGGSINFQLLPDGFSLVMSSL